MIDSLDTAGRDLDEARARIEATRTRLLEALNDGGQEQLQQAVAKLDRILAGIEQVEEAMAERV